MAHARSSLGRSLDATAAASVDGSTGAARVEPDTSCRAGAPLVVDGTSRVSARADCAVARASCVVAGTDCSVAEESGTGVWVAGEMASAVSADFTWKCGVALLEDDSEEGAVDVCVVAELAAVVAEGEPSTGNVSPTSSLSSPSVKFVSQSASGADRGAARAIPR